MRPLFYQGSICHYSYAISISYSRKLVGYDQGRAILGYSIKRLLNNFLGLWIKRACGLVE
jgi:hypothetical protein